MDRRRFLSHSCSLGVALPTLASSTLALGLSRQAAAQAMPQDYKALVCILLAGGNDSYNMLVPADSSAYAAYAGIRSDLALPISELLPLAPPTGAGQQLGVHPGMASLQQLVNNGDASMIANIGTLLEPFDPAAVSNGTARLPVGLFSHADQISQWQTAIPDGRGSQGWAGRIADRMLSTNPGNGISMNISLSGTNTFQSGAQTREYSIDSNGSGATGLNGYGVDNGFGRFRTDSVDALLAISRESLLKREYARRFRSALDAQVVFAEAMQSATPLTTEFSPNPLSAALRQIARVISVRDLLGATRQTFFVTIGGWDHHDEVLDNQARMLPIVADALAQFRDALQELAVWDAVTTFTISDFGRTLTSNGRGSDHGWGGHHIVMGGAINGGEIFGHYPEISMNSPLDVGRGIYAPTTPTDTYFADLALWLGVPRADLDQVLPQVRRFYTPEDGGAALGIFPAAAL
ncbi:MAG: DUF1501 domain-containing protein [Pseudomonadota bacterium]